MNAVTLAFCTKLILFPRRRLMTSTGFQTSQDKMMATKGNSPKESTLM
jgi:hypothetical protein